MHKIVLFLLLFSFGLSFPVFGQATLPPKEAQRFHKDRRALLRQQLPPNSVAVLFANPIRNRSNDVNYVYHQDPNFFYLTGWPEAHAVFVLYSDLQKDEEGTFTEQLFILERNARSELYDGYRLGVDGAKSMGFERVSLRDEFVKNPIDFNAYDQVLILNFHNDERDFPNDPYDLYQLKKSFKQAIDFPEDFNRQEYNVYQAIQGVTSDNFLQVKSYVKWQAGRHTYLKENPVVVDFLNLETLNLPLDNPETKKYVGKDYKFNLGELNRILGDMREVKTPFELKRLKRAIEISAIGQVEVMKALHPKMSEREVQGIHEYVFKKYGAAYEGYPSIVGAGKNGCILHYIENSDLPSSEDLILMDLGAEYEGYTADVTRTLPVSGKFSKEQRQLYQLVYDAQEVGIAKAVVGSTAGEITRATQSVIKEGLLKLGIIQDVNDFRKYYPHGAVHHIGLDVHDLSNYGPLPVNSVITVEPGIYIPENSPCDPKWWGIGIRIEDDILITPSGPENLSARAPRKWQAIEAMMAKSSALDDFKLPELSN